MMWLGLGLVTAALVLGWWAAGGFSTPHNDPNLDNRPGDPR